ncbi:hypothetical protein ACFVTE_20955 [Arthrobacter sp. NPDC058097]
MTKKDRRVTDCYAMSTLFPGAADGRTKELEGNICNLRLTALR